MICKRESCLSIQKKCGGKRHGLSPTGIWQSSSGQESSSTSSRKGFKIIESRFEIRRLTQATQEEEALEHDRGIFPRQTRNHRGELVFDVSNAKMLLRGDVVDGKHLTMQPAPLH
jgi:hypothetical protein